MSEALATRSPQTPAAQQSSPADHGLTANDVAAMRPPVDVIEDAAGITLVADLPGVPKDAVQVRVEADTLTIEGEVRLALPADLKASHLELEHPRWRRSFTLSKELDAGKITAESQHGVLTLRIPKAAHAQPRRIQVTVA
jgi:HSP20 family molecular chaperone IbpA